MITSPHNEKLKQIRKLRTRRERERTGLFVAEGDDLVQAAAEAGWTAEFVLWGGDDVEPRLLDAVSNLGSGTRVIGVYRQRWNAMADGTASLSVYLHGVGDPGNVGTTIRSAHALADGPVVLGPDCADPFSPKAVRASMGSIFSRPPARMPLSELPGRKVILDPAAPTPLGEVTEDPPLVVCVGAEREGVPQELLAAADATARIAIRPGGPDSLNAAMAATVALYELGHRMLGHA